MTQQELEKEFAPYEIALQMKELGYNERNIYHYANGILQEGITYNSDHRDYESISAPLYQQAFRWFREKYRLDGKPEYFLNDWYCFIINDMKGEDNSRRLFTEFPSHEEAELECLKKLIQIVKERK
jgi:hypothetical protein